MGDYAESQGKQVPTAIHWLVKEAFLFAHFNNTSSMTTGVLALIECFKFAGMWTQVPA